MVQSIPSPCIYSHDLHKLDLKGKTDINWIELHREHLDHWHSREHHVFVADVGVGVSDNYHQWFSSITLPYLTRIGGGHSYTMDLLDLIDSVYKGEQGGDVLAITARARHVLQEKFSLGYYQDLPVEDRRAKENELKGKSRRVGKKGGPGVVNVPRIRGKLPDIRVVDEGVHLGDEGDVHLSDEEVHLDDGGGIPICNNSTFVQEDDVRRSDIDLDARERSFCPRWNLLPSNDSLLLSPPYERVVDQSPPLSQPTFNLFTQSPSHPVHQPTTQKAVQQSTTHQLLPQPTTHESVHHPAQQQLPVQQPAQYQPAQKLPVQRQPAHQQTTHQQPAQEQTVQQQQVPAVQQLQQPVQREHIMQLRTRKQTERNCGTNSKKEIQPYKRRHLVLKYQ